MTSGIPGNVNMKAGWEKFCQKSNQKNRLEGKRFLMHEFQPTDVVARVVILSWQISDRVINFFNNWIHVVAHLFIMLYYKRLTLWSHKLTWSL